MLKTKALQPLLLCESGPTPAPNLCPCARGSVLLSAWGRVHESRREPSVLAPPPKGCFPWGRGRGSPPCHCLPHWQCLDLGLAQWLRFGAQRGFCTSWVPFPGASCAPAISHTIAELSWTNNFYWEKKEIREKVLESYYNPPPLQNTPTPSHPTLPPPLSPPCTGSNPPLPALCRLPERCACWGALARCCSPAALPQQAGTVAGPPPRPPRAPAP